MDNMHIKLYIEREVPEICSHTDKHRQARSSQYSARQLGEQQYFAKEVISAANSINQDIHRIVNFPRLAVEALVSASEEMHYALQ